MNVLIVGQGGREHALAWKAAQSPLVEQVWVAPGNAGTALENKVKNISIAADDIEGLLTFAEDNEIKLTIIGPEVPLSLGITNQFTRAGLLCFGPSQAAAELESSKAFCKDFLKKYNIPTAHYTTFTELHLALQHTRQQNFPIVIKADGLAAGKGVVIAENFIEAEQAITEMLSENRFGQAGQRIVIEEFLAGEELSYIVMTDGKHILPFASSQDHKRLNDGDLGPNTGGMGAYSPAPLMTTEMEQQILENIIKPTIQALAAEGKPYLGFLYAGLMVTPNNEIKVLEFNCRLGDPETEPLLLRLKSDLVGLCLAALEGQLNQVNAEWDSRPALGVVMAAGGYPFEYRKGDIIQGLNNISDQGDKVFHAGTKTENGKVVTQGGRVLVVTALGDNLLHAQQNAYALVQKISWDNCFYRKDIGWRGL